VNFNQYFYKEALPRTILLNKPSVYPIDQGGPPSLGSSVSRLCALAPITPLWCMILSTLLAYWA
jgi:hypothetical protein